MKKLLWLAVPVIFFAAYMGREQLAPSSAGVPNTGSDVVTQASTTPSISIVPQTILQGDPAEVVINGAKSSDIESLTYKGKPLAYFVTDKPRAAVGVDLREPVGSYPIVLTLADGTTVRQSLVVGKRVIPVAPLGIPESLGGNTPQAAQNLVTQLAKDNAVLNSVPTTMQKLWDGEFQYPVANPVVTDTYGYTRDTVNTTISHKGTDFHAPPGTPVMAMNSGVVRVAQFFTAYGNTVIIDHGFGIQTLYMHMSELDVKVGDRVGKGQVIGKSGETGYAEGPHLHISVKIGGISIDPQKFLKLF